MSGRRGRRRDDPVRVDVELPANGFDALESTVVVDPDDPVHLPCEWPRPALFYDLSIRPEEMDTPETIRYDDFGRVCKKIAIETADTEPDPVTFYSSYPCPEDSDPNSCA